MSKVKRIPLGEVGTFQRGGNFKKSDFIEDGYPCIHYGQIHTTFGAATKSHITCIPDTIASKCPKASKGDLVIAITSEDVAGSCKCTTWLGDYDIALGGHIARYRHKLNPKYVSYFFQSPIFHKDKSRYTRGFKVTEIKPSDIAKIAIPVIGLEEQRKTVEHLDDTFEKIDMIHQKASKALQMVQSIFIKELETLTTPQANWKSARLKVLCNKIGSGATPRGGRKTYITEGCSLIRSLNVHKTFFKYAELAHITDQAAQALKGVTIHENDVLFNITGASIARCCVVPSDILPARVNQHVSILRTDGSEILPDFLCYVLNSPQHQKSLLAIGENGATRQAITKADLEEHLVKYPDIKEQKFIVEKLKTLSDRLKKMENNYTKLIVDLTIFKQALLKETFE